MYKKLEEVFDIYMSDIKYDELFYKKLKQFRLNWAQKSDMYIEFLGSNLTGCQSIRFSSQDEDMLYEIFNCNQKEIQQEFYKVKGIDKNMKTISNSTYIILAYCAHKFITNKSISNKLKEDMIKEVYYIFMYKMCSSLMAHYYKFDLEPSIAKAVVERLSNKFLIKKYNSWQEVFEYKSKDFLPKGIHYNRLIHIDVDNCGRIISDVQTKLRDIFKNTYAVLIEVRNSNEKIYTNNLIQNDEEGESIRAITNRQDIYTNYIKTTLLNKTDFINRDIVNIIVSVMKGITDNDVIAMLEYFMSLDPKESSKYIDEIINCSLDYIIKKKYEKDFVKNLYLIIVALNGYWKSSNVKDKDFKETKNFMLKITKNHLRKKTNSVNVNISISIIIYITIRSLWMKK